MGVRDDLEKLSRLGVDMEPITGLSTEMEKLSRLNRELPSGLESILRDADRSYGVPGLTPTTMHIQGPAERAAESFMEGLRDHADRLQSGLREDQELHMLCYHGPERLRVLEISMPSENVVSLRCLNADGDEAHVTGHMHAVTFSYVIHAVVPPEVKRPIGFRMPSEGES